MEPHDTYRAAYLHLDSETLRSEEQRLHDRSVQLLIQSHVIRQVLQERAMEVVRENT